jgi:hypothetical protein
VKAKRRPRPSRGDWLLKRLLSDHFRLDRGDGWAWTYREDIGLGRVDPKLNASLLRWAKKHNIET